MSAWMLLVCCLWAEPGPVTVEQLSGPPLVGTLRELDAGAVRLEVNGTIESLPITKLLEIRWPASTLTPAANQVQLTLQDGSQLEVPDLGVQANKVKLTGETLGNVTLPRSQLRSVRIGASEPKLLDAWQKLCAKDNTKDVLVVRKGETLDFLSGVIGDVGPQTISFLVDGEEVPVKRERVYGLIYPPAANPPKGNIVVTTATGQQLQARLVRKEPAGWRITLAAGADVTLPEGALSTLDFSAGKVRALSAITPRDVQYTPYLDVVWEFQRDRGPDGEPLQLNGKTYRRGLSIHSRTLLKYRLNGEYRTLQATVGIDDLADPTDVEGDVVLTITGDGRELFRAAIKNSDPPRPLELDLSTVRDLEILVDFGEGLDIADWLDLADAKVLK